MKFTHRLMKLEDGRWTTVHKNEVEKFKKLGYEMGPESMGAAKWHIDDALAFEKYGKAYQHKGKYRGMVAIKQKSGLTGYVKQENVEAHLKDGDKLGDVKDIE